MLLVVDLTCLIDALYIFIFEHYLVMNCSCAAILSLGDSIAANNAYRQRETELSVRSPAREDATFAGKSFQAVHAESSGSAYSIDTLIEKLQNGAEVTAFI